MKFYVVGALFITGGVHVMMTYPGSAFHHDVGLAVELMGLFACIVGLGYDLDRATRTDG